jgi:hypothetical protein
MATLFNNDFVVKAGLVVEGTGTVSTNTSTINSVQLASGLLVSKNLVVKSTSTFLGKIETFNQAVFNSGATIKGTLTATDYIFALVSTATNLAGGSAQSLVIQLSTGTTSFIPIGQPKQFLSISNNYTVAWQDFDLIEVGYATTATNLKNGIRGQIPYQSNSGTTAFINTGNVGTVLISNAGLSAPVFTNELTNLKTVVSQNLTVTNFTNLSNTVITLLTATDITVDNALRVKGKTYILGDLYVDGTQFTLDSQILSSGNKIIALSTSASSADFADTSGLYIGNVTEGNLSPAWAAFYFYYANQSWRSKNTLEILSSNQSSSTASGALQVVGGVGIGGNLYVGGAATATTLRISGSNQAISNNSGALTVAGGVGIGGNLYVGGDTYFGGSIIQLTAGPGTFTSVNITGPNVALTITNSAYIGNTLTVKKIVVLSTLSDAINTSNNSLYVAGGVGISGVINAGDIYSNGVKLSTKNAVQSIQAGTDTAVSTASGDITVIWNTSTLRSVTSRGSSTPSAISITNNSSSTSTNTGALIVDGGVGIGGNLWVNNSINIPKINENSGFNQTRLSYGQLSQAQGNLVLGAGSHNGWNGLPNSTPDHGTIVVWNTGGVAISGGNTLESVQSTGGIRLYGGYYDVYVPKNTPSISTTTGALQVIGGVGVGGTLNVGGDINVTGSLTASTLVGTLAGYAATASTILTGFNGDNSQFYLTFVSNNNLTLNPSTLYTSNRFKINANSGAVTIGTSTNTTARLTIDTSNNLGNTALLLTGAQSNQDAVNLEIIRNTNGSPSPALFRGANIRLGVTDNTSTVILQEYQGSLLFFSNSIFGNTPTNGMTFNSRNQLLINYPNIYSTNTGILSVNGDGYFVGVVTATNFIGNLSGTATNAKNVEVMQNSSSTAHYLTFVSNNSLTALNQKLFTTSTFSIDPRTGVVAVNNTTLSTGTNTGALVVRGGVGIGGALYVNTTSYIAGFEIITTATIGNFVISIGTSTTSTFFINNTTASTSTNTGALTVAGGVGVGGALFVGNTATITSSASSTSTTTGALLVTGGVGIGGALYAGNIYSNGSKVLTEASAGGVQSLNGLTGTVTISVGTDTAISTVSNNIIIWNTSTLQSVTNRGNTTNQSIFITNTTNSTSTASGALRVAGGAGIGGNVYIENFSSVFDTPTLTISGNNNPTLQFKSSQGSYAVNAISLINYNDLYGPVWQIGHSNILGSTASFVLQTYQPTEVSSQGSGDVLFKGSNNNLRVSYKGTITIYSTATSISTTTGALQVAGGVGIGGNLYVANISYVAGAQIITTATIGNFVTSIGTSTTSTFFINNTTTSTSTNTGALTVAGGVGVGGALFVGNTATITSSAVSTSTTTGALKVTGGVGIGGNLYAGNIYSNGSIVVTAATAGGVQTLNGQSGTIVISAGTDTAISTATGTITIWNTSTLQSVTSRGSSTSAVISITNTTNSTSTNSGALQVAGGVGIGGNLYVGGTITANILTLQYTTVTTTSVTTDDIISTYNTTQSTSTNSGALQVAGGVGIGGALYIGTASYIAGAQIITSATIGSFVASVGTGTTSTFFINNTTTSTSTNSGALVVAGGVGIGGTLYVNTTSYIAGAQIITSATIGNFVTSIGTGTTSTFFINNTTTSTSTNTGALIVTGGVGIGGRLFVGNTATIVSTATSTSTTTGALLVTGGVGIGGNLYVANTSYVAGAQIITTATIGSFVASVGTGTTSTFFINNTTESTSTNSGALVVTGGVGIGGNLNLGGILTATQITQTSGNIRIGQSAGNQHNAGTIQATAIGAYSGSILQGNYTTAIGSNAGYNRQGNYATAVGYQAGNQQQGAYSLALGYQAGLGSETAEGSIILSAGSSTYVAYAPNAGFYVSPVRVDVTSSATSFLLNYNVTTREITRSSNIVTLSITSTATSNSTNTGALQVTGGVGIGGTLYVGNTATITSTATSTSTTTGALLVTGGVGVGGNIYAGNIYSNGSMVVTAATAGGVQSLNGLTGTVTISVGTDTAISTSSNNITIWNTSTLQSVTNRGSSSSAVISFTNTSSSTSTTTGALVVTGGVGIGGRLNIAGPLNVGNTSTGTISAITYGNTLLASYTSGIITSTSTSTLDSFDITLYRSAKYFCQVTSGSNYVHISEISVFHAINNAYINEYGISVNNTVLGTYDASINGNNLIVTFTPSTTTATVVKMTRLTLTI